MVTVRFWVVPWTYRPRARSLLVRDMIGAKMIRTAGRIAPTGYAASRVRDHVAGDPFAEVTA
jgi:hypothetical protein